MATVPNDLIDAVIQQLQTTCGTQFGDTAATPKIFADYAGQAALPYAVITELGQNVTYFSKGASGFPTLEDGQFQVAVFSSVSRHDARRLADAVAFALTDADLMFNGGTLKMLRPVTSNMIPTPDVGPGSPTVFQSVIVFAYQIQGSL